MKASEIKPGGYYRAADVYEGAVILVRVLHKSDSISDHWACLRPDGRKVLLPTSAFIRAATAK